MKRFLPALALLLAAAPLHGALVPFTQDYQSIAVGGSMPGEIIGGVTTSTNTWSVVDVSGNHAYQNTLNGTSTPKSFDSLLFDQLGGSFNRNFEMSAVISPVSVTAPTTVNYTAGLRFLAAGTNAVDNAYVADINIGASGGRMRIVEWTGATAVVFPSATQSSQPLIPSYSSSKSYLLDVLGTYDASNALTVVFTATEVGAPANTQSYTFSTDTTPRSGQFFGYYDSMGASGGTMVVNFDNLAVVPESATLGILGAAGAVLLARRSRRDDAKIQCRG